MAAGKRTSTAFPSRLQAKADRLLDRINARRKAIEKQKGMLPESYPLGEWDEDVPSSEKAHRRIGGRVGSHHSRVTGV
jgi:hypothetical protein